MVGSLAPGFPYSKCSRHRAKDNTVGGSKVGGDAFDQPVAGRSPWPGAGQGWGFAAMCGGREDGDGLGEGRGAARDEIFEV